MKRTIIIEGQEKIFEEELTQVEGKQRYAEREEFRLLLKDRLYKIEVVNVGSKKQVFIDGEEFWIQIPQAKTGKKQHQGSLKSPMPGKLLKLLVKVDEEVKVGTPLMVLEAMKMEHTLRSPIVGRVRNIFYKVGDLIPPEKELLEIEEKVL